MTLAASLSGDRFYVWVATMYRELSATSTRPAAVMAEQAGVSVRTAHSWIYRARQRGHLESGQKGTAGRTRVAERIAADLGVPVEQLEAAVLRHTCGVLRVGRRRS